MAINGVGSVNGVQTEQIKKNVETGVKQVEDAVNKKDNKQKLALALGALGAVGAAAVGIAMKVKKGKGADVADMAQDGVKKLSDIKFEKGIAKQGKKLFTGNIEDTLNSGKKVTLKYKDGKLKRSILIETANDSEYPKRIVKNYDDNGRIKIKFSKRIGCSGFPWKPEYIRYENGREVKSGEVSKYTEIF